MRSRIDVKPRAGGPRARPASRPGGKALQRLFHYLGTRNPAINDDVVAAVPVGRAVRPQFGLTARARGAPVPELARARRARRAPSSRPFAAALAKAAIALSKLRRPTTRGAAPGAPLLWKPLGPSNIPNGQTYGSNRVDVIGRVASIAIDPTKPTHVLCGAGGGGIWETADGGATWAPRTEKMPSLAIGAIAFDPSNPKTVYAGSGEGNFYFNLGAGAYKSTDGGKTWKVLASAPFVGAGFFDLVVDSKNSKVLYAATTIGFCVSTNGGSTWRVKRSVRCWDISLHPGGGPTAEILAAFADGLFVSTSAGASFAAVGLPSAPAATWSRLAVDRVSTSPDVAYAFGAAGSAAHLWRRTGTTWTKIPSIPALNVTQAWYDWYAAATPNKTGQVFLGAIDTIRGDLTGSTWQWTNITTQGANSIHPDQHCLAFAPGNSKTIYLGNDGGIFRSQNSGGTWKALNKGLGITELEYLGSDPTTANWLMAGTQDNGTIRFRGSLIWDHIADGDGGDCGVNQFNPNEVYHSYYGVSLERSTNRGTTWASLAPPSMSALFYPPVEVFGTTVGIGGVSLDVSRNRGASWKIVALGLPAGDAASAMDIPDANTVFIGTRLGRMVRLVWNGSSWTKTALTSPAPRYISCVRVDPDTPKRLWVTISQIGGGMVYRSDDTGLTWVNCSSGLPAIPMNSVVVDPANGQRVWVAADVGVYQTMNLGAAWASFSLGLPNAMAADLLFHRKDRVLICGTRNRGAWAIAVP